MNCKSCGNRIDTDTAFCTYCGRNIKDDITNDTKAQPQIINLNINQVSNSTPNWKCFTHSNKDANATCLKCGKAMCMDCSSFSKHKGKCPTCSKTELEQEVARLKTRKSSVFHGAFGFILIIIAVIFFVLFLSVDILDKNVFIIFSIVTLAIGLWIIISGANETKKEKAHIQD